MKKIIISISILSLCIPLFVSAQIDQRCWKEDECIEYRKANFVGDGMDPADGFYSAEKHQDAEIACKGKTDAAGEPVGFCLPAGQSVTGISFGGKNKFSNIVDFIQYIYRYGFIAGTIIAVAMVIMSGMFWIFSGGNTDGITKAKNKLSGAVIGLILLAISYTILNLINPYLVNLRVPSVWAVNRIGLAPAVCSQLKDLEKASLALAYTATQAASVSSTEQFKAGFAKVASFNIKPNESECGNGYFTQDGKGLMCEGYTCKTENQVCWKKNNEMQRKCTDGIIAGNIYHSGIVANADSNVIQAILEEWEFPWVTNAGGEEIELCYVCNTFPGPDSDGCEYASLGGDATGDDVTNHTQRYLLPGDAKEIISKATSGCKDYGGLKGFLLEVEFNEAWDFTSEVAYLGNNNGTSIFVATDEDIEKKLRANSISTDVYIKKEQIQSKGGIQVNIDAAGVKDED